MTSMSRKSFLSLAGLGLAGCATTGPGPDPDPQPDPVPAGDRLLSSFLRWDAQKHLGRMQSILSRTWTDDQFSQALAWHKSQGDNTLMLCLGDVGDNGAAVCIYRDSWFGGAVDDARIVEIQGRLQRISEAGFSCWFWLTSDDSRQISTAGLDTHLQHADLCMEHFGGWAAAWCAGLEIDEDGRKRHEKQIIARLQGGSTAPVYTHYTRHNVRKAIDSGADGHCMQWSFSTSYGSIESDVRAALGVAPADFLLHATEYDRDSSKGWGKRLVDAIADPRLTGYGNG